MSFRGVFEVIMETNNDESLIDSESSQIKKEAKHEMNELEKFRRRWASGRPRGYLAKILISEGTKDVPIGKVRFRVIYLLELSPMGSIARR